MSERSPRGPNNWPHEFLATATPHGANGAAAPVEMNASRIKGILHRHPPLAAGLAVACGSYFLYYLIWRLSSTLNSDAAGFSLVVWGAEAYGLLTFVLFAFMVWDVSRKPISALQQGLKVDIYVPTYNEDITLLEATLTGCNQVRYPHTTYLLDDGQRPEVERLALRLGCRYLTRPDNQHAKAGNLNAALPRTDGDFIAILDADTIPQPDFIDSTLGYFVDQRVALVQLPQEFFNLDSAQHLTGRDATDSWHEQELFYRVIQPGKNRWNSAFWCGSPSVVRRSALVAVGGVATETVTEDIHTSIRLHGQGWKTVYHDEVLAFGQAPQTLHAFAVQRLRWAQGSMQLLRSRENPLIAPGLTIAQRLNYLASMLTYFDSYQKLVLLATPSLILVTGVLPIAVNGIDFFTHWLPYYLLVWGTNTLLGRRYYRHVTVEQFNLLKMFLFLRASLTLVWPRSLTFRVTPKSVGRSALAEERTELVPHMVVLAGVGAGLLVGLLNLAWGISTDHLASADIVLVTLLWSMFNAAMLVLPIVRILRRAHNRMNYRFPVQLTARMTDQRGKIVWAVATDLSRFGARLTTPDQLQLDSSLSLTLELPDGPLAVEAEVAHKQKLADGLVEWGLRFTHIDLAAQQRLTAFLFITACREQRVQGRDQLVPRRPEAAADVELRALTS